MRNDAHGRAWSTVVAVLIAGVIAIAFLPAVTSGTQPSALQAASTHASEALMRLQHDFGIPGVSGAVVTRGELVWSDAFGIADIEADAAATIDTRFRLGSVSKLVTAVLAARLAQDGMIDLDDDVRGVIPELDSDAPVTIRQLLAI